MIRVAPQEQHNFPFEDISDDNAAVLEVLVSDWNTVERAHEISESNVFLYKIAHQALKNIGNGNDFSLAGHAAFSHGAAIYETIATYLRHDTQVNHNYFSVIKHTSDLLDLANDGKRAATEFIDARDRFKSEQPNVFEVVKSASSMNGLQMPEDYLAIGAAIERQLEIEIIESFDSV